MSRWDNRMVGVAYLALLILCVGLFTSTSLCSLALGLLYPVGAYFTWHEIKRHGWDTVPNSAWALLVLIFISLVSCVINYENIESPLKAALKTKYFLLGIITIFTGRHLLKAIAIVRARTILLGAITTFAIASTLYGLLVVLNGNDFLNLHDEIFPSRNQGFSSYMRHAHSCAYIGIIFLWGLTQLKKVNSFEKKILFLGLVVVIIGAATSGTRGALGALIISAPLIWGHSKKMWIYLGLVAVLMGMLLAQNLNTKMHKGIFRSAEPDRINMWFLAIKASQEKPLLGHGVRQFEKQAPRLEQEHGHFLPQPHGAIRGMAHAHNVFFQFLVDVGIFGLVSYLVWIWFWLRESWINPSIRWGIIAFVACFSAAGLLQYVFDTQGALLIMVVYGLSCALNQKVEPANADT